MTKQPWDPSLPLRADATDSDLRDRYAYHVRKALQQGHALVEGNDIAVLVAREIAAACVAATAKPWRGDPRVKEALDRVWRVKNKPAMHGGFGCALDTLCEAVAAAAQPDSQTWSEEEASAVLQASHFARERRNYTLASELERIAEGMAMLPDAARSAPEGNP